MNISAIICEYNPLHNGHMYQIDKTKKITGCDGLIAIMSGNFVQRGEPAIIDKWHRTKMALNSGIDLVIELPVIYALSSAEYFAHGSVTILNNLNVVSSLCFGSECGDITPLFNIAQVLCSEPNEYRLLLKEYLSQGLNFPLARSIALEKYFSNSQSDAGYEYKDILTTSNNILGIEYCKSLIRNSSNIKPYTITRLGSGYNDESISSGFSSATAIRKFLKTNENIDVIKEKLPKDSFDIIMQLKNSNYDFVYPERMFEYIKYKSLTDTKEGLALLKDSGEGLYNRVYKYINNSTSIEELAGNIKTKRYTYTRINRLLAQYFIGFENYLEAINPKINCGYARVLGFNARGIEILNAIKKNSDTEIITKLPKYPSDPILKLDIASTRAYSIINKSVNYNDDYLISPIVY